MSKIVGIDLGTTNSEVAYIEAGKPTIIKSVEGQPYFPSVVAFTKEGEMLVGEAAKRQAVTNPEGTISRIKRKMGRGEKITIRGKNLFTRTNLCVYPAKNKERCRSISR